MCLNPVKIHIEGKYKDTNALHKQGDRYDNYIWSKCGTCAQCLAEKANNWVVRNHYELKASKKATFITLTYKKNPHILMPIDYTLFKKRLRQNIIRAGGEQIKTFDRGEYGEKKGRPHYHAIIYNWQENIDNLEFLDINKNGNLLFRSETVEKSWNMGRTSVQNVAPEHIAYISGYTTGNSKMAHDYKMTREKCKKMIDELESRTLPDQIKIRWLEELVNQQRKQEAEHAKYMVIKEFNHWSNGIGYEEWRQQYNPNAYEFVECIDGKEYVTPTSWIKKLIDEEGDPQAIEEMKERQEYIDKQAKNMLYITTSEKKTIETLKNNQKELTSRNNWTTKKLKLEDL